MIKLHSKFEVSKFIHYEDMKAMQNVEFGVAKFGGVWMTQCHLQCHHLVECL